MHFYFPLHYIQNQGDNASLFNRGISVKSSCFFKIFFICNLFLSNRCLFGDVSEKLVRAFLSCYFKEFIVLNNKYVEAEKSYRSHKTNLENFRKADWKFTIMDRTSLSYKLQNRDKTVFRIIDEVCRQCECEADKDELIRILEKQVQKPTEALDLEYFEDYLEPIEEVYYPFMQFLCDIYEEDCEKHRKTKFRFFLNQFTKIRKYIFDYLPRMFYKREANRFLHNFIKKSFSCMNRSTVDEVLSAETPKICTRVKDVSGEMRFIRTY